MIKTHNKIKSSNRKSANSYVFVNTLRYISSIINDDFMTLKRTFRCTYNKLYTFYYDPLYKDSLLYYDIMPLILVYKMDAFSFYGFNFHFLLNRFKQDLFRELSIFSFENGKRIWKSFNLSKLKSYVNHSKYSFLNRHYLFNRMCSKFIEFPVEMSETIFMNYIPSVFHIDEERYEKYKKRMKKRVKNKMKSSVYNQLFIKQNNIEAILNSNDIVNRRNETYMKIFTNNV